MVVGWRGSCFMVEVYKVLRNKENWYKMLWIKCTVIITVERNRRGRRVNLKTGEGTEQSPGGFREASWGSMVREQPCALGMGFLRVQPGKRLCCPAWDRGAKGCGGRREVSEISRGQSWLRDIVAKRRTSRCLYRDHQNMWIRYIHGKVQMWLRILRWEIILNYQSGSPQIVFMKERWRWGRQSRRVTMETGSPRLW